MESCERFEGVSNYKSEICQPAFQFKITLGLRDNESQVQKSRHSFYPTKSNDPGGTKIKSVLPVVDGNAFVLPSTNLEFYSRQGYRSIVWLFGHFLYLSVMFPNAFCLLPLFCATHLFTEASADYAAKRWQKYGQERL